MKHADDTTGGMSRFETPAGAMARRRLLAGLLFGLAGFVALAGATPIQAASFDCAKATHQNEKLICDTPELSAKDDALAAAYDSALAALSEKGQEQLRTSQRSWLRYWPMVCFEGKDIFGREMPDSNDPAACALAEYERRISQLSNAVQRHEPYVFLLTHIYTAGELGGINYTIVPSLTLDAPADETAYAFDTQARHWIRKLRLLTQAGDGVSARDTIEIYAQEGTFVGLEGSAYQYNQGAAHGGTDVGFLNFILDDSTVLDADKLFLTDTDWATFLVTQARQQLDERLGADAYWPRNLTLKQVSDPEYWKLTPKGFTISFPLYSIGPYAMGIQSVEFPWDALQPYLAPTAPAFTQK